MVDVVSLLVRVRMKETWQVMQLLQSMGVCGLNWGLIADWLTRRLIADWLIRMRLYKQIPHGCCDVIGFEGILGDTPS